MGVASQCACQLRPSVIVTRQSLCKRLREAFHLYHSYPEQTQAPSCVVTERPSLRVKPLVRTRIL